MVCVIDESNGFYLGVYGSDFIFAESIRYKYKHIKGKYKRLHVTVMKGIGVEVSRLDKKTKEYVVVERYRCLDVLYYNKKKD